MCLEFTRAMRRSVGFKAMSLSRQRCRGVRNEKAITLEAAIRKITFDLAAFWGLKGRGWLREGYHADIVVFDPETIAPEMPELLHDLPAGAPRITQKSAGIRTTIVNGQILMRNNVHSGAYPGQLLRGPLAHN